jgi:hypothetical protein
MKLSRFTVNVTTDDQGDAVAYSPQCNGLVRTVEYVKPTSDGLDAATDIDIIADVSGAVIWTNDDLSDSKVIHPLAPAQDNTGADIVGAYAPICLADERIKITVANGGNTLSGQFVFTIEGVALS